MSLKSRRPPTSSTVPTDWSKSGYLGASSTILSQFEFSPSSSTGGSRLGHTRTCLAVEWADMLIWDVWCQVHGCAEETSVLLNTPGLLTKVSSQRGKQHLGSICVNIVWPGVREGYASDDLTCLLSHPTSSSSSPWIPMTGRRHGRVGQLKVSVCLPLSANWRLLPWETTD